MNSHPSRPPTFLSFQCILILDDLPDLPALAPEPWPLEAVVGEYGGWDSREIEESQVRLVSSAEEQLTLQKVTASRVRAAQAPRSVHVPRISSRPPEPEPDKA